MHLSSLLMLLICLAVFILFDCCENCSEEVHECPTCSSTGRGCTTQILFEPMDFVAWLATLGPRPRANPSYSQKVTGAQ